MPSFNENVIGFFNDSLWTAAAWSATTFRYNPTSTTKAPPALGIVFANRKAGEELFLRWVAEYGNDDLFEAIRISIIEGDIPNLFAGYSVHICPEPTALKEEDGNGAPQPDTLARLGRVNRMRPRPEIPPMLPVFKQEFQKYGEYMLGPVVQREDGQLWFDVDLGIIKHTIHFRNAPEIGADDIDAAALISPSPVQR